MELCPTLRGEVKAQKKFFERGGKSFEMSKSFHEDNSILKILNKSDLNDESFYNFDHLTYHREKYAQACQKIKSEINSPLVQLELIETNMENNPIKCQKYNYTI